MGRRKNGMGGVSLRKDGRWEGRVVIGYDEKGLPKTKNVLAKTKGKCLEKLKALKENLVTQDKPKYSKQMTFGEWIDFWFREFCSPRLKDSTKQTYGYRIYKQIIPNIGHISLPELKTSDLQAFYGNLKTDGRLIRRDLNGGTLSESHIRAIHTHCNASLNKAVEEGLIFKNPASECRLPPKRYAEMKVLTHNEIHRLLVQAKEEDLFEMFFLDLSTGMRRGELIALQWDDEDFEKEELHIKRQVSRVNGELVISTPKTKNSVRTIKLSKLVLYVLTEYKRNAKSKWLFPSPLNDDVPREPSACRKRLSRILEHDGCKHVRFHDLRHTFATMALENGIDIKTLAEILGHNTVATALNTYTHSTAKMQESAARRIDRTIGGVSDDAEQNIGTTTNLSSATEPVFAPYKEKKRKPGTGYIKQLSANCWQGRYTPRVDGKRVSYNVYGKTEEECEAKLAEIIREKRNR